MIRIASLIIFFPFILFGKYNIISKPVRSILISDTVICEIDAEFDSNGLIDRYSANISTPVCEVDKCYTIDIKFTWDLLGRFISYDTINGKGLTKLDHIPFTEADYQRLAQILSTSNSPLKNYNKEELVKNTRSSEIDGVTGATIQEIKENVIEGAVYSCYTLWHIAQGSVVDSIQHVTASMLEKRLVSKLVNQHDQDINYFLINQFSDDDFIHYNAQILEMIGQSQGYFAKNAIEKMPAEALQQEMVQFYFAENFDQLNYYAQVALLKKLEKIAVNQQLKKKLKNTIDERNSFRNELINSILESDRK